MNNPHDDLEYVTNATLLPINQPFAICLTGKALEPRYQDGAELVIDPQGRVSPGVAVLACFNGMARPGVMLLNADGDLYDFTGGYHALGQWHLIGVVVGTQNDKPN